MSTTELVMAKTRRRFSLELKKHIIAEIESGQVSLSAASRKYSISATAIARWREKERHGELVDKASAREVELEKKVEGLERKVGEQAMEIDVLKKLDAYERRLRTADSSVITGLNWDRFRKDAK